MEKSKLYTLLTWLLGKGYFQKYKPSWLLVYILNGNLVIYYDLLLNLDEKFVET